MQISKHATLIMSQISGYAHQGGRDKKRPAFIQTPHENYYTSIKQRDPRDGSVPANVSSHLQ